MGRRAAKRRAARLLTSGMRAGDYRVFHERVAAPSGGPPNVTERRGVTPTEALRDGSECGKAFDRNDVALGAGV